MTYDHKAFIEAFLDARDDNCAPTLLRFRKARLEALEKAFGATMPPHVAGRGAALRMLFVATADTWRRTRGTRSGFLEDSLINLVVMELPDGGKSIDEVEALANGHLHKASEALFLLLERLHQAMGPPARMAVSSADLLAFGFDDTKEPTISDYIDEL